MAVPVASGLVTDGRGLGRLDLDDDRLRAEEQLAVLGEPESGADVKPPTVAPWTVESEFAGRVLYRALHRDDVSEDFRSPTQRRARHLTEHRLPFLARRATAVEKYRPFEIRRILPQSSDGELEGYCRRKVVDPFRGERASRSRNVTSSERRRQGTLRDRRSARG